MRSRVANAPMVGAPPMPPPSGYNVEVTSLATNGRTSRDYSRVTLVLYRKRTERRFRLASTSGVRFRYSRQKEAACGCGGRGVRWEFVRFLPEKPCQTGTLAKTILLIFTM